jgi:hypothetical protein
MAIYFTLHKNPAPALTVIFDADGFERARRYKQSLIRDGAYQEDQVVISGTDATRKMIKE